MAPPGEKRFYPINHQVLKSAWPVRASEAVQLFPHTHQKIPTAHSLEECYNNIHSSSFSLLGFISAGERGNLSQVIIYTKSLPRRMYKMSHWNVESKPRLNSFRIHTIHRAMLYMIL